MVTSLYFATLNNRKFTLSRVGRDVITGHESNEPVFVSAAIVNGVQRVIDAEKNLGVFRDDVRAGINFFNHLSVGARLALWPLWAFRTVRAILDYCVSAVVADYDRSGVVLEDGAASTC